MAVEGQRWGKNSKRDPSLRRAPFASRKERLTRARSVQDDNRAFSAEVQTAIVSRRKIDGRTEVRRYKGQTSGGRFVGSVRAAAGCGGSGFVGFFCGVLSRFNCRRFADSAKVSAAI